MQDYNKYIDMFEDILDGKQYETRANIAKFEGENQVKLPEDFIDFILAFPIKNRYIDINKGYGPCKTLSFKGITITSELGVINDFPHDVEKLLINGKERVVCYIGSTLLNADFLENFYMILDKEEYGTIYHYKFFELAMHYMYIKVADNFIQLFKNVLNGKNLPDDDSSDFEMHEDEDEEYFTEEEKELTHSVPYYF